MHLVQKSLPFMPRTLSLHPLFVFSSPTGAAPRTEWTRTRTRTWVGGWMGREGRHKTGVGERGRSTTSSRSFPQKSFCVVFSAYALSPHSCQPSGQLPRATLEERARFSRLQHMNAVRVPTMSTAPCVPSRRMVRAQCRVHSPAVNVGTGQCRSRWGRCCDTCSFYILLRVSQRLFKVLELHNRGVPMQESLCYFNKKRE